MSAEDPNTPEIKPVEEIKAEVTQEAKEAKERANKFWRDLGTEAAEQYNEGFKKIIRNDEFQYNGDVYKFRMINHKDMGRLKKLQAEKVDEDQDWEKYVANYKERAKLLIENMDDAKFDSGDFFILENLVTAWSVRATKGFRHLLPFLRTIFEHGQTGYDGNKSELRIFFIHQHLKDMPVWTWDTEHYGEDNQDMIGKFYQEDFENIKQIDSYEMIRQDKEARRRRK